MRRGEATTGTFATTERAQRDEATNAEGAALAEIRSGVARSGARATRRSMVGRIRSSIPLSFNDSRFARRPRLVC